MMQDEEHTDRVTRLDIEEAEAADRSARAAAFLAKRDEMNRENPNA
jgi:hypothetical protein